MTRRFGFIVMLVASWLVTEAAAKNVNLTGKWTGTATTSGPDIGSGTYDAVANVTQTKTSMVATVAFMLPGDVAAIFTEKGQISGTAIHIGTSQDEDVEASGTISANGMSGSGKRIVDNGSFTGSFTSDGKHMSGSAADSFGNSVTWSLDKCKNCPSKETTSWDNWGSSGTQYETLGLWNATLLPSTMNFTGGTVQEQNGNPGGGGSGMDKCWFLGSAFAPFDQITGGTWTVGQGNPDPVGQNQWGQDFVGWTVNAVQYYRQQGRAPCGTQFLQVMEFFDPINSGFVPYGSTNTGDPNTLGGQIGTNTVSSTRTGKTMTKKYP